MRHASLLLFALVACSRPPTPDEQQPAAAAKTGPTNDVLQKRAEARKQAEQKAAAEAEQKAADLEALAQPATSLPKTLPIACDAMVAAYDKYMRRVLVDDMLTKWTTGGNEMQVKVFKKECLSRSIPVAACQAGALAKMTRDQYPLLADVMGLCLTKFGS